MIDHSKLVLFLSSIVIITSLMLFFSPSIHRWERENNYPYGQLCELYRSCR